MTSENEAVMRAMYSAFSELAGEGDKSTYVSTFYDPDAVYEPVEEADPVIGHDALVRWHERWFDAWDELHATPDELISRDSVVYAAVSVRGRGAGSGTDVNQRFFHVTDVENGTIRHIREYLERDEALRAAGL